MIYVIGIVLFIVVFVIGYISGARSYDRAMKSKIYAMLVDMAQNNDEIMGVIMSTLAERGHNELIEWIERSYSGN